MRILVLAAPCVHLGYLGCYGCDWVRTPHLDRLAAESIVFDQHYVDTPAPRTAFHGSTDAGPNRSWWTGRYWFPVPEQPEMPGAAEAARFFALLEAQGIANGRIIARSRMEGVGTSPTLRFPRRRLLETLAGVANQSNILMWVDLPSLAPPWPVLPSRHLRPYFPREKEEDEEPLSPWTDPPHGMLDPADETALERLQLTYAAALTYFDAQVGCLLQELRDQAWYDNLLLIFTADRGLALGEHGTVGEALPGLYEEVIHLPLVIRLPGGAEAGRRVAALTQPVDLYPTLLEALGLEPPEVHGRSLLPLARGQTDAVRAQACAELAVDGAATYALRTLDWSFILPTSRALDVPPRPPQLFVKPDDRWEVNDVLPHNLELGENLEKMLRDFVAATQRPNRR